MKVVALGGCGGMGRYAVRTVLNFDFVDKLVIADQDGERARQFAQECGPKASAAEVDVEDSAKLVALLSEADVVLATVGPYFRLGLPVLRAAIETGCDYFDINDDWESTLDMLNLDEEARRAGVTAIIGMGASPGLSNMLAMKAMSLLDSVEDLITGWGLAEGEVESEQQRERPEPGERRTGGFSAAVEHWVHQCSGTIRVFRGGEFVDVAPIEEIKIDYPGIGLGTAHTVGHPEPITLPRLRPELRNSCNVMVMPPGIIEAMRQLTAEVDAGRMTVRQAAEALMNPSEEQRGSVAPGPSDEPRLPEFFAYASGLKNGQPARVGVTISSGIAGGMGGMTGVPMATGLAVFARGQITGKGVFAPEDVFDSDAFYDEIAPLCTPKRANAKEMLIINTSF